MPIPTKIQLNNSLFFDITVHMLMVLQFWDLLRHSKRAKLGMFQCIYRDCVRQWTLYQSKRHEWDSSVYLYQIQTRPLRYIHSPILRAYFWSNPNTRPIDGFSPVKKIVIISSRKIGQIDIESVIDEDTKKKEEEKYCDNSKNSVSNLILLVCSE